MKTIKEVGLINLSLILISVIYISACDDVTNSVDIRDAYEIKAWDYSDNHYFLDTIYKQSFLDYYNNNFISSHTDSFYVDDQSFEVWVQTDVTVSNYRRAALHINLPSIPVSGKYNDSFKVVSNPQQGISAFGLVRKLQTSEYTIHKYAGYVSLIINLPENYFAGVAYKRPLTGEEFGSISTDTNAYPTDTLVLKMIKVQNLVPQNLSAWELKLKNIYQLPRTNILQNGFEFDISYLYNGVYSSKLPNTDNYLITILGLDKYSDGRIEPPDNKFDFIANYTIDPDNGWIIFPTLKPFLTNFQNFSPPVDSVYWYPQIYNDLKSNSNQVPNANNYKLSGYIKR